MVAAAVACGAPGDGSGASPAAQPGASAPGNGTPAVVLVSFDGFRHDYLERYDTPAFDRLATEGVRADALVPVFPSKTFPSHYSLVTGLYPGHHGIISNHMRDPRWPEQFHLSNRAEVEKGRWWGGEPIWVTAERQGLVAASLFWPGSEAPVQGSRPSHWRRYDGSMPHAKRIATVLGWLDLPAGQRPGLVAAYFEEPNEAGHAHGPESSQVERAVERMDGVLGELLDGLASRGWPDEVAVVVVSDHGMAATAPDRVIVLDDLLPAELLPLRPGEVFEQGALLQLFPGGETPNPSSRPTGNTDDPARTGGHADRDRADRMYRALAGAHPALSVYRRGETPDRYHLDAHPRLPPLLGVPDVGWEVFTRAAWSDIGDALLAGDHGQDPADPRMHGIFLAAGPPFSPGTRVSAVEAVDVYLLLCAALGLGPAPNDGDAARIAPLISRASPAQTSEWGRER